MRPIRLVPALVMSSLAALGASAAHAQSSAKRTLNADGSTSMTYSQDVALLDLDGLGTQVGLDMSAAKTSVAPAPQAAANTVSGTAYAKVSAAELPDWLLWQKGAVNIALSPTDEESRVGTTFSRSWTINDGMKAVLADSYEVDRSASDTGWQTSKSISLANSATGTTVALSASANDEAQRLLPSISAQQKVLGALQVTTTVADNGSDIDKSITAGFSHRW